MIAGVCGGIGDYFNIDETLVRLAVVLIAIVTKVIPVVIIYLAAAIIIPMEPEVPAAQSRTG